MTVPAGPDPARQAPPTLLAVAHGTRDAEGVAVTEALVAGVRALRPGLRVERCFLDLVALPAGGAGRTER